MEEHDNATAEREYRREGPSSPWNSLEVAKLSASLLTPALVTAFGLVIALGAERRDEQRNLRAERRAEAREARAAERGFRWQQQLSDRSAKLARDLDQAAAERAASTRLQDRELERQSRQAAAESAKRSELFARRLEFWEKWKPLIGELGAIQSEMYAPDAERSAVLEKIASLKTKWVELAEIYSPYVDIYYLWDPTNIYFDNLERWASTIGVSWTDKERQESTDNLNSTRRFLLRMGADFTAQATGISIGRDRFKYDQSRRIMERGKRLKALQSKAGKSPN